MKTLNFLLFLPIVVGAQSASCNKTALLYSRELFPGEVTVARAVALSGYENECAAPLPQPDIALPKVYLTIRDTYQYYPIDGVQQDIIGRDIPLTNATDQLVKHLVFDR